MTDLNTQLRQIETRLKRAIEDIKRGASDGVEASAKSIFDASQQLVPVESGRLKNSGFVETTETATGTLATVGYRAPYASQVHENMEGSSPKFLQRPAFEMANQIPDKIVDAVKRKLR